MKRIIIAELSFVAALIIGFSFTATPAHSLPQEVVGKWTSKKGKCKDEELITRISKTTYSPYETMCLVKGERKVDALNIGLPDYDVKLSCESEGERSSGAVYIFHPESSDQLKVWTNHMKDNEHQWLFRCKGH